MTPNWTEIRATVERVWEHRDELQSPEAHYAVGQVIAALDHGELRVAEPVDGGWQVNEWSSIFRSAKWKPSKPDRSSFTTKCL
jgi:2,3,4,5-tetrahydropyridine-2-carboxylate N-succinyltransferase